MEVPEFTRDLHRIASDEELRTLQLELLRNPTKGDVMQGNGGLRKVRMKLPGRGKSGGARVIYLAPAGGGKDRIPVPLHQSRTVGPLAGGTAAVAGPGRNH